jgi:hypothetical protein
MPNSHDVDDQFPIQEIAYDAVVPDSVSPSAGVTAHCLAFGARVSERERFEETENPALD